MKTITVQPNQSMQDVVLTACGTLEGAMGFCRANDVSISDVPAPGTVYVVPEGITTEPAILQLMADRRIVPGTLAQELEPAGLVMTVVLRPLMDVAFVVDEIESGYDLVWSEADGFVHVNALGSWAVPPVYLVNLKSAHDVDDSPTTQNAATYNMAGKALSYIYISGIVVGEQVLWYAKGNNITARYRDSEGNEALYAPFVYYDTDTELSYMLTGTLDVEQVAATSETVTVRCAIGNTSMIGVTDYAIARYYLRKRVEGVLVPIATVSAGTYDLELTSGNHEIVLEVVYATIGEGITAPVISAFTSININIA